MVLLFYVPKYKSASKKDECCLQSPTIGPTFQSGTEKPFKMVSLISYIVEGLLLRDLNLLGIDEKVTFCQHNATESKFS